MKSSLKVSGTSLGTARGCGVTGGGSRCGNADMRRGNTGCCDDRESCWCSGCGAADCSGSESNCGSNVDTCDCSGAVICDTADMALVTASATMPLSIVLSLVSSVATTLSAILKVSLMILA